MAGKGVTTFVELGPKRVLCGLVKRIIPQAKLLNVADETSLRSTIVALSDGGKQWD